MQCLELQRGQVKKGKKKKKKIHKKEGERVIELQKTINIKGFRPGKAPVDL